MESEAKKAESAEDQEEPSCSMPGWPGECPEGIDWSDWLAMNNVD